MVPEKYRQAFVTGIIKRDLWVRVKSLDSIHSALWNKSRKQFKLTKTLQAEFENCVERSINDLGFVEDPSKVTENSLELDIFNAYYDYQDWIKEGRRRRE